MGIPTVGDRVAQTVVKIYFEPKIEPLFFIRTLMRTGRGNLRLKLWNSPAEMLSLRLGARLRHQGFL